MSPSSWIAIFFTLCLGIHACAEDTNPSLPPDEQVTSSDLGPQEQVNVTNSERI